MGKDKTPSSPKPGETHDRDHEAHSADGISRRRLLGSTAAGAAVGAFAVAGLGDALAGRGHKSHHGHKHKKGQRILLEDGVVLTLDPSGRDYERADVLIDDGKIVAIGPHLHVGGHPHRINCKGKIVMPGFIDTHHHQYETQQRAVIPDGPLFASFPQEAYTTVVQAVWTSGRITSGQDVLWDLGRSPYDPEDCYIAELVASVAAINNGVTTGIDTSQSSHTAAHTDAMIQGLMDSGRRTVYTYAGGRTPAQPGYEFPGTSGDTTSGIGRIATKYFNSSDQLVTLAMSTGDWALAREFGARIVNHDFNGATLVAAANNPAAAQPGPDLESIHAVNFTEEAWQVARDYGVHISIAAPIEMQMGHGTPPVQECLRHDILPALSCDVDTNMSHDMFTQMRTVFTLQHLLVNPNATHEYYAVGEPPVSCYQVLEMATRAGASAAGLSSKVGILRVGMEADVIVLNARDIGTHPMVNAPGTVVTMMDTRHVETVIIRGKIMKQNGELVGVNVDKLLREIERSQERILSRIHGPYLVGPIPDFAHEYPGYTPTLIGSCCRDLRPYPNAQPSNPTV